MGPGLAKGSMPQPLKDFVGMAVRVHDLITYLKSEMHTSHARLRRRSTQLMHSGGSTNVVVLGIIIVSVVHTLPSSQKLQLRLRSMRRSPAFGQLRENASRGRGVAVHKVIAALLVGGLAQAYTTVLSDHGLPQMLKFANDRGRESNMPVPRSAPPSDISAGHRGEAPGQVGHSCPKALSSKSLVDGPDVAPGRNSGEVENFWAFRREGPCLQRG